MQVTQRCRGRAPLLLHCQGFADFRSAHNHLFAQPQQSLLRFFQQPPSHLCQGSTDPACRDREVHLGLCEKQTLYVTSLCAMGMPWSTSCFLYQAWPKTQLSDLYEIHTLHPSPA